MTSNDAPGTSAADATALENLETRLSNHQVIGTPVQQGKTTLVPATYMRAGGGVGGRAMRRRPDQATGGGGFVARPAGAWAIAEDGCVSWHAAVDINRIVLGGQLALAAVLIAATAAALRRRATRP
ncbi:MAG: hypothetical protein GEV09_00720 [Pseudonocardiaceae bacterium]|nr:hypothetical protein [Pseudonocardiaceae bacterium]